jgi:hypothetical protein
MGQSRRVRSRQRILPLPLHPKTRRKCAASDGLPATPWRSAAGCAPLLETPPPAHRASRPHERRSAAGMRFTESVASGHSRGGSPRPLRSSPTPGKRGRARNATRREGAGWTWHHPAAGNR